MKPLLIRASVLSILLAAGGVRAQTGPRPAAPDCESSSGRTSRLSKAISSSIGHETRDELKSCAQPIASQLLPNELYLTCGSKRLTVDVSRLMDEHFLVSRRGVLIDFDDSNAVPMNDAEAARILESRVVPDCVVDAAVRAYMEELRIETARQKADALMKLAP